MAEREIEGCVVPRDEDPDSERGSGRRPEDGTRRQDATVPSGWVAAWVPERGARMARREERGYRAYL